MYYGRIRSMFADGMLHDNLFHYISQHHVVELIGWSNYQQKYWFYVTLKIINWLLLEMKNVTLKLVKFFRKLIKVFNFQTDDNKFCLAYLYSLNYVWSLF